MNLKYAPAVAMAISLASASSAQAVCVSPPFPPPFFTTFVQVDVSSQNDCEMVPIQSSILGANAVGNGDATAKAGLGSLGVKVHDFYTSPISGGDIRAGADAGFTDLFPILIPGAGGADFLSFTLSLTGGVSVAGDPGSFGGGFGGANLSVVELDSGRLSQRICRAQDPQHFSSRCRSAWQIRSRSLAIFRPLPTHLHRATSPSTSSTPLR